MPTDCGVVDGNNIPRQSDVTANLNISATLPNEVFGMRTSFRTDIRYTGPYYADDMNVEERSALALVNVSANMRNENWNFRFFINNLTDEDEPTNLRIGSHYTNNANPTVAPLQQGGYTVFPRRPREIGLQAIYNF